MSWLESVYCDYFALASNVYLEGFGARMYDFERAFIGQLERSAMSVTTNENKFGLQKIVGNRRRCGAVLKCRNWDERAYLVAQLTEM